MKTEQQTKVAYFDPSDLDNDTGKPKVKITSEKAFNAKLEEAKKNNEALPELKASQTFTFSWAETVDEAVALAGGSGIGEYENTGVFLDVFNYGGYLRQHNAANAQITEDSFVSQDGAVDMSYAVAEKRERAKMSPEEKAIKALNAGGVHGVTPEQLREALALIRSQAGASASA